MRNTVASVDRCTFAAPFHSNPYQASMRHRARLLVVLVAAAAGTVSGQQPLQQHAVRGSESVQRAPDAKINSTTNLIFWSVFSLLQQRPNTRYLNGMVPFQPKPTVQRADMR